jgi:hypothetical protein
MLDDIMMSEHARYEQHKMYTVSIIRLAGRADMLCSKRLGNYTDWSAVSPTVNSTGTTSGAAT